MIVCTGRSTRHVKALADSLAAKAKEMKAKTVRVESDAGNEWILVDLGDVVAHIMVAATRSFYGLEDLWEPVKELREKQPNALMRIRILTITHKSPAWIQAGYEEYAKRLPAACSLELLPIPAEKRTGNADLQRIMEKEGEKFCKPSILIIM